MGILCVYFQFSFAKGNRFDCNSNKFVFCFIILIFFIPRALAQQDHIAVIEYKTNICDLLYS